MSLKTWWDRLTVSGADFEEAGEAFIESAEPFPDARDRLFSGLRKEIEAGSGLGYFDISDLNFLYITYRQNSGNRGNLSRFCGLKVGNIEVAPGSGGICIKYSFTYVGRVLIEYGIASAFAIVVSIGMRSPFIVLLLLPLSLAVVAFGHGMRRQSVRNMGNTMPDFFRKLISCEGKNGTAHG